MWEKHGMIRTDKDFENKRQFAAEIAEVERQCFHDAWNVTSVIPLCGNPDAIIAAKYDGDDVCGELIARCAADECELYRIAILPQYRGRGHANSLMTYLVNVCKERKIKNIFLEVRCSNTPAIKLYEGFGFEIAAIRKKYYREPQEDAKIYILKI